LELGRGVRKIISDLEKSWCVVQQTLFCVSDAVKKVVEAVHKGNNVNFNKSLKKKSSDSGI
jgi:hypothetical protein